MARLEGKTAIVTGASRGIGRAIAEAFVREGADVVIASRKQASLDEVVDEVSALGHPGRIAGRACHTGDADQIAELVSWAEDEFSTPTILVNNAATNPYFGPMLDVEWSAWDKTFEVNVKGYFEMTRQVARRLIERELPGSIVNVSSVYGLKGAPLQGVYAMTKASVVSMTQTLALELGGYGIRVNAICPGLVETKFAKILTETPMISDHYCQRAALNRWGQPEELAGIALFLASNEANYVTGQSHVIDGGFLIGE